MVNASNLSCFQLFQPSNFRARNFILPWLFVGRFLLMVIFCGAVKIAQYGSPQKLNLFFSYGIIQASNLVTFLAFDLSTPFLRLFVKKKPLDILVRIFCEMRILRIFLLPFDVFCFLLTFWLSIINAMFPDLEA